MSWGPRRLAGWRAGCAGSTCANTAAATSAPPTPCACSAKQSGLPVFASRCAQGAAAGCWRRRGGRRVSPAFAGHPVAAQTAPVLAGLGAVLGHTFTFWLGFKGGKGVATSAGVMLGLAPLGAARPPSSVWAAALKVWRYVSLASILAGWTLPVAVVGVRVAHRAASNGPLLVSGPPHRRAGDRAAPRPTSPALAAGTEPKAGPPQGAGTPCFMKNIGIIGSGSWGTALGVLLAGNASRVRLWGRETRGHRSDQQRHENPAYLPGTPAARTTLRATTRMADLADSDAVFVVVPSRAVRAVAAQLAAVPLAPGVPVVSCMKGIENGTGLAHVRAASRSPARPAGGRALRSEPRRGNRPPPARRGRHRLPRPGARPAAPGTRHAARGSAPTPATT